jgi:hypothetical protein
MANGEWWMVDGGWWMVDGGWGGSFDWLVVPLGWLEQFCETGVDLH